MALFPVLYVFWQSYIRHPQWKIPLEKSWKCHFQDSKFQNVPRCLGPSGLVPLVRVPKLPKTHLRSACYLKSFWQPWVRIPEVFFLFLKWHLVKILLTGSNYKQKTICEDYICISHYETSFNQKEANRSTVFVALCIYKAWNWNSKKKFNSILKALFICLKKKLSRCFSLFHGY